MNKILALDQASATTGYAIFDKENNNLINCGKFTFEGELGDRLVKIRNKIIELIKQYEITEVLFEDIQFQSNVGNNVVTFKTLSEVFGVVHELLEELNIPYTIVHSETWKSSLHIKGKNRKEQKAAAKEYVLKNYNLDVSQDICDAICIGSHFLKKDPHDWSE